MDLNADLGEGMAFDAELLSVVTSANVACGGHAGDAFLMQKTVRACVEKGVSVGAHPSWDDRPNFGRSEKNNWTRDEVRALVFAQLGAFAAICRAEKAVFRHVKPHGAMYNQSARDPLLAREIAEAVRDFDPKLILVGLAASHSIAEAKKLGLRTAAEIFADRAYADDGSLVPRTVAGAVIHEVEKAVAQTMQLVQNQRVMSISGELVELRGQTVCLHGDGPNALELAKKLRAALEKMGIEIAAF